MSVIEPVEITLDKPRKLLINHRALRRAESEVNKLRFANPGDYANIDGLMVSAYNQVFRLSGMLPRDLLCCVLWAGLLHEDPKLTLEKIDEILDNATISDAEISGTVWAAYYRTAGRNLKTETSADVTEGEEKKTEDPPTGSANGPPHALN